MRMLSGLPQVSLMLDIIQSRLSLSGTWSVVQTHISVLYKSVDGRFVASIGGDLRARSEQDSSFAPKGSTHYFNSEREAQAFWLSLGSELTGFEEESI